MRRAPVLCALALLAGLCAGTAAAHPLAPALFEVREQADGRVAVAWKRSLLTPTGADLVPELPPHCTNATSPTVERDASSATLHWTADCGDRGLVGSVLRVRGLETSRTDALVRVELADGRRLTTVLNGPDAAYEVADRQTRGEVFIDYLRLGFDHILTGFDHLLFVLGLVLLVHSRRSLVATITSFTLGHSVTLSLAVLGYVSFPSRLIEVGIAFSIFLLAVELARGRLHPGLMGRRPWSVALAFGLLHGFGFAGALAEVGLPSGEIPMALFSFNVGIELGQLLFVAAVLLVQTALRPVLRTVPTALEALPAYGIGSLAVYWCLERISGL